MPRMASHGTVAKVGVEGTGTYGAGLARHLVGKGMIAVPLPDPTTLVDIAAARRACTRAEAALRQAVFRAGKAGQPVVSRRDRPRHHPSSSPTAFRRARRAPR
ncbi:MAG: hypothetical protein M3063_01510 [Actinomycetota bacterium]|nr:hypothetical protein [Actinomycetota bacterium]